MPKYRQQDVEYGNTEVLDLGYKEALRILYETPILIEHFTTAYDEKQLEDDINFVKDRKEEPEEVSSSKKYAAILQAILYKSICKGNWIKEAKIIKPSMFDVLHNHEIIISWPNSVENEEEMPILTAEMVVEKVADERVKKIKNEIQKGKLGSIKYLEYGTTINNHSEKCREKKDNVPRLVLGVHRNLILELMNVWLTEPEKITAKIYKNKILQSLILREIEIQLTYFKLFAEKKKHDHLVKKYVKLLQLINTAITNSNSIITSDRLYNKDTVFKSIGGAIANNFARM